LTKNVNIFPFHILNILHNISFSPQEYTSWPTKGKCESSLQLKIRRDFTLPPWCRWDLFSFGIV